MTLTSNRYFTALDNNRNSANPKQIIYTDESYIHLHHQITTTLHDPKDPLDKQPRLQFKGQRDCFVAAIKEQLQDTISGDVAAEAGKDNYNGP